MATIPILSALFVVLLTVYELISDRIFVRGLKAVKREGQLVLFWAAFAFQTIGMAILAAVLLHSKM